MATNAELHSKYTAHGLQLIRLANGLSSSSLKEIRELGRQLKAILNGYEPNLTQRELTALLKRVDSAIAKAYSAIAVANKPHLRDLIEVETSFALKAAQSVARVGPKTVSRLASQLLVHGAPVSAHWERQGSNLSWNVANAIRAASAAGTPRRALIAQVVGSGAPGREMGGLVDTSIVQAKSLVDSAVQSGANSARVASMRNYGRGINCLMWNGTLDTKICPNCALRVGKLYDLEYKPLGHSTPLVGPPPLHPFCRCILVPQRMPKELMESGGPALDKFEDWLEKQPKGDQEELLGVGRVALWREGRLTLQQLVGQDGLVMNLDELRRAVASRP